MPAGHRNACVSTYGRSAFEDASDDFGWQFVHRHAKYRERQDRLAAHRIDVRKGVGGGDAAVVERVIDNPGEKIGGCDERALVVETLRRLIISVHGANQ